MIWAISGPSGSGKTTLAQALATASSGTLRRAVTCTTRAPRAGERDGVDYHFVDLERFEAMRVAQGLVEETSYKGACYGLPVSEVEGKGDVLAVVDQAGIRNLRNRFGEDVLAIGLMGLGEDELAKRMAGRGETPEQIAQRLAGLEGEIRELGTLCDFVILLGGADEQLLQVQGLMKQERERRERSRS